MDYQVGRVYKICKNEITNYERYMFVVGVEGEGKYQKLAFNDITNIGRKMYLYLSDMQKYDVRLIS